MQSYVSKRHNRVERDHLTTQFESNIDPPLEMFTGQAKSSHLRDSQSKIASLRTRYCRGVRPGAGKPARLRTGAMKRLRSARSAVYLIFQIVKRQEMSLQRLSHTEKLRYVSLPSAMSNQTVLAA